MPSLTVQLSAPAAAITQASGPAGQLVLFAKLYDVGPDGTQQLINGLVAPARIADVTRPVHITLPASRTGSRPATGSRSTWPAAIRTTGAG